MFLKEIIVNYVYVMFGFLFYYSFFYIIEFSDDIVVIVDGIINFWDREYIIYAYIEVRSNWV